MVAAVLAAALVAAGITLADTGTSYGATYDVSTKVIDLGARWHVNVGQLSGGNDTVATAFNNASVASGRTMGSLLDGDDVDRDHATFDSTPTVSFRPTAVAQVLHGAYYHQGAAHPLNYVTTIVIDARTATPITLDDLFVDTQAGLRRLSEQTKKIWPTVYGRPMSDEPGNAPAEARLTDTYSARCDSADYQYYQFGHGQPVITVPWSQVSDLLAPDMRVLAV
ncbi:DUF3298 domain-containing protein [Mycobacterium sp. SMC-13]|uniref:DUF3298 domain-containing protein n=1 Tax=Mycobacterium sp. SMC-13 TaxID=3381626 RepID=UPI0038760F25